MPRNLTPAEALAALRERFEAEEMDLPFMLNTYAALLDAGEAAQVMASDRPMSEGFAAINAALARLATVVGKEMGR